MKYAYGAYADISELYKYVDLDSAYLYWSKNGWYPGNSQSFAQRVATAAWTNVILTPVPDSAVLLYGCTV